MGAKLINVFDTNNIQGLSFSHIFDKLKNVLMFIYQDKMCESVEEMSRLANYKEFDSGLEFEDKIYVYHVKTEIMGLL